MSFITFLVLIFLIGAATSYIYYLWLIILDKDKEIKVNTDTIKNLRVIIKDSNLLINKLNRHTVNNFRPTRTDWKDILGISSLHSKIDSKLINSKYTELAKIYHPDKNGGSSDKMKILNNARDKALKDI